MELTRRDAIAALTALGGGGIGYAACRQHQQSDDATVAGDETVKATLVAAADVLYPSAVEGVEEFVEAFVEGRLEEADRADGRLGPGGRQPGGDDQGTPAGGVHETVTALNELAAEWHGAPFPALPTSARDRLLREVGADTAEEDPDGTTAERVRYYVVNELLLALYTSPTGGELVGIENPQGHPGGIDSYQRGPR